METLKIILLDDCDIFREGVQLYLEEILHHQVIATYSNAFVLLSSDKLPLADIILMDIQMPGMNGFETTKKAQFIYPEIKVLAISNHCHQIYLEQLIYSGFKGCIHKDQIYNELNIALKSITQGKLFFGRNIKLTSKATDK